MGIKDIFKDKTMMLNPEHKELGKSGKLHIQVAERQGENNVFNTKKLGFNEEIGIGQIALNETVRGKVGVEPGDKVILNGTVTLEVTKMKQADINNKKNMALNPKHIEIEKSEHIKLEKAENNIHYKTDKLGFSDSIPEDCIALTETMRKRLGVKPGDMVVVNDHEKLKVIQMKKTDIEEKKKNIMLNTKYQAYGNNKNIKIVNAENIEEPDQKKHADGQAKEIAPQAEKKPGVLRRIWFLGKVIWNRIFH